MKEKTENTTFKEAGELEELIRKAEFGPITTEEKLISEISKQLQDTIIESLESVNISKSLWENILDRVFNNVQDSVYRWARQMKEISSMNIPNEDGEE